MKRFFNVGLAPLTLIVCLMSPTLAAGGVDYKTYPGIGCTASSHPSAVRRQASGDNIWIENDTTNDHTEGGAKVKQYVHCPIHNDSYGSTVGLNKVDLWVQRGVVPGQEQTQCMLRSFTRWGALLDSDVGTTSSVTHPQYMSLSLDDSVSRTYYSLDCNLGAGDSTIYSYRVYEGQP
jgi:hypothetical protein